MRAKEGAKKSGSLDATATNAAWSTMPSASSDWISKTSLHSARLRSAWIAIAFVIWCRPGRVRVCSILGSGGGGLGVSRENRGYRRGSVARRRAHNHRDRSGGDEILDDARLAAEPTPRRGRLRIKKRKRRSVGRKSASALSLVWDLLRVAYRALKRRLDIDEGDGDGLTCFGRGRSRRGPSCARGNGARAIAEEKYLRLAWTCVAGPNEAFRDWSGTIYS